MKPVIDNIECVAEGKFLRMEIIGFTDSKGKKRKWEAVSRTNSRGAALIIPHIVPDDSFVLVRQFRAPAGKMVLELPAGLIDEGEDAATAALRELYEETGYEGKVVRCLPPGNSSPGMSGETVTIAVIEIDGNKYRETPPVAHPEENESIEVFTVPRGELREFITSQRAQGVGIDAKLQALLTGMNI
ncbi:MAG: NUDIX hydrolase [Lentisphaeria bacterium]|nr:NUDIX hydrolase [Lentisphaeria bacterium]